MSANYDTCKLSSWEIFTYFLEDNQRMPRKMRRWKVTMWELPFSICWMKLFVDNNKDSQNIIQIWYKWEKWIACLKDINLQPDEAVKILFEWLEKVWLISIEE